MTTKYGECSIKAVYFITHKGYSPIDAWEATTIHAFGKGSSSQKKVCPRGAFLGLCSNGDIKGVPGGDYTKSILNKEYAIRTARFLRSNPKLASSPVLLWRRVIGSKKKQHNNQLDVVLALWNNKLLT